jgi:alpha-glucosidase
VASFSLKELLDIARSLGARTVAQMALYPLRRWRYQRLGRQACAQAAGGPLGDVVSVHAEGAVVDLACTCGRLRLELLDAGVLRFRLCRGASGPFPPLFSYALDPGAQWPSVSLDVEETPGAITLHTPHLTCRVDRAPCRLSLYDAQGQPLSEDSQGFRFEGRGAAWARRLAPGEAIYGLGEKAFGLDLRGQKLEMWNRDPSCYLPGDDPLYASIPFFVALRQGRACGFFLDNPGRAWFDLGHARAGEWQYQAEAGELCGYFFAGPSMAEVLERYTRLTGRMSLPPRWLLGYQQSRWSYYPEARVREIVAELRQRRIPCDVIYLDIHYMDGYRVFTWDRERFPDLPGLIQDLRAAGVRVIPSMDTGVKVDPGYAVHDDGLRVGAFCKLPGGTLFRGPVWPGDCYFPDFSDPAVRSWWGDWHRGLLEAGVAGIWNDMNEPAVFGGEMAHNVLHAYEGPGARHDEVHNVYGLQEVRACAEGVQRLRPGERVPLISRSGYAGIQRYSAIWTGDNHSTWEHLRLSVSMCLNLGLSGVALCGADVGGFAGDCDAELLARWTELGALTPYFRNHSALGTAQQEPWAFGEPYESICRRAVELRYELLPYVYTAAWQAAQTGLPMMRPLALAWPDDARACHIDDQFLLGDALLVAPVLEAGRRSRPVYLPEGIWYDFWTGQARRGEVAAEAPLDRMPLFVRAGTVLPLAPVMQHTGGWPPQALRLLIYPGDGESWLYEDDGHSLAYRSGEWRLTRFACRGDGTRLTVARHLQGPFDPGYARFEVTLQGLQSPPAQVWADRKVVEGAWDAETGGMHISLGPWDLLEVCLAPGA